MKLIEIDPICAELTQTAFDGLAYVSRRRTTGAVLAYGTTELGGDDHVVTMTAESPCPASPRCPRMNPTCRRR